MFCIAVTPEAANMELELMSVAVRELSNVAVMSVTVCKELEYPAAGLPNVPLKLCNPRRRLLCRWFEEMAGLPLESIGFRLELLCNASSSFPPKGCNPRTVSGCDECKD
jgi:hypothetical protein